MNGNNLSLQQLENLKTKGKLKHIYIPHYHSINNLHFNSSFFFLLSSLNSI